MDVSLHFISLNPEIGIEVKCLFHPRSGHLNIFSILESMLRLRASQNMTVMNFSERYHAFNVRTTLFEMVIFEFFDFLALMYFRVYSVDMGSYQHLIGSALFLFQKRTFWYFFKILILTKIWELLVSEKFLRPYWNFWDHFGSKNNFPYFPLIKIARAHLPIPERICQFDLTMCKSHHRFHGRYILQKLKYELDSKCVGRIYLARFTQKTTNKNLFQIDKTTAEITGTQLCHPYSMSGPFWKIAELTHQK